MSLKRDIEQLYVHIKETGDENLINRSLRLRDKILKKFEEDLKEKQEFIESLKNIEEAKKNTCGTITVRL